MDEPKIYRYSVRVFVYIFVFLHETIDDWYRRLPSSDGLNILLKQGPSLFIQVYLFVFTWNNRSLIQMSAKFGWILLILSFLVLRSSPIPLVTAWMIEWSSGPRNNKTWVYRMEISFVEKCLINTVSKKVSWESKLLTGKSSFSGDWLETM